MPPSVVFRGFVAVFALLTACSPSPVDPQGSGPEGGAGALQGGSGAQLNAAGGAHAGVGGAGSNAGSYAGFPSAGLGGSGAGGAEAGTSSGGSGGSAGAAGGRHGTVPTKVTWKTLAESTDSTFSISLPSAASRGKDAAVAYVERATGRVVMQRFDASGERIGSLVVLASNADERSNVTLASDGKQYAACWNVAPEIHCSLLDEQEKVHLDVLAVAGQYATIVAGATGWALAYSGADKHLRLQPLTAALELNGSYIGAQLIVQHSVQDVGPLFASTPSGYALVASNTEAGNVDLLRLSADLQSVVSATGLGHGLWYAGQLVASDTRAAVSLSVPYGSFLLLLDAKKLTAELPIAGGGKSGTDQALVLNKGGVGAAWLDRDAAVRQRFLPDGHDSEIGLDPRTPATEVLGLEEEGDDSYQQLVQVGDQSLLIARTMRYASLSGAGALRVAVLKFGE